MSASGHGFEPRVDVEPEGATMSVCSASDGNDQMAETSANEMAPTP